ncbi:16S rRNA (cytosine(1402)-N(4))-methyltransferase RsmH [Novisyntrophococcus fermenticellae]|uniref:16S rRNA (cytosine(1402)-N(4))-methyltransferase RsmH n=1 Tax=Novisyntrophococcus fermenticellae TaxID=2068655 RepID=UPI001E2FF677|nr:16S rRNA (cytosine(1402)-N(4))-methyltransferase RsmH [Novisyntrophococcus fermenticellae]
MNENKQSHKRRVRYKGTHPKSYQEKYKELNPEKYPETIERVIQKGGTPVGTHIPICVKEILEFLQIKPGQKGLDATLGYGGHSREMMKCLQFQGHLYALDVDAAEMEKTRKRLEQAGFGAEIFTALNVNFADIDQVTETTGKFDFVLADLGVSSMQIDNPERGFTYKREGPLDLRLNQAKGISAAERLKHITKAELVGMLTENADEPYAEEIAAAVAARNRKEQSILTTYDLRNLIDQTLRFVPADKRKDAVNKSCQRTFQALRIDVNQEFEVLYEFLQKLPGILNPGGRAAILTFHSGEDRIVKKLFKEGQKVGDYSAVAADVIRPSAEECHRNSRARSTKMRWAIKA